AVQQPLDLVQGRDHDDRRAAQVDARFEGVEAVDLGESHRGDTRVRDEPGHPLVVRTGQQDQIAVAGLAEQVVRSYCTHLFTSPKYLTSKVSWSFDSSMAQDTLNTRTGPSVRRGPSLSRFAHRARRRSGSRCSSGSSGSRHMAAR